MLLAPALVQLFGGIAVLEVLAKYVDSGAKFAKADRSPERVDDLLTEVLTCELIDDLVISEEFGDGRRNRLRAQVTQIDATIVDPKGDVLAVSALAGDREVLAEGTVELSCCGFL